MPTASVVAPGAQKCLYNAYVRIVRGFSSLASGQDRLGGLEGRTRRANAWGRATCCIGEAGFSWRAPARRGFSRTALSEAPDHGLTVMG